MKKNVESGSIEQLLAEADELIRKIHSDAIKDMEERHRLEFEKHTQNLEEIKSRVQGRTGKEGIDNSPGEGIHEAIQDIVNAMKGMAGYLT